MIINKDTNVTFNRQNTQRDLVKESGEVGFERTETQVDLVSEDNDVILTPVQQIRNLIDEVEDFVEFTSQPEVQELIEHLSGVVSFEQIGEQTILIKDDCVEQSIWNIIEW